MDRIIDRLWIGATEDFRAPLADLGFVAVLDLRDNLQVDFDVHGVDHYRVSNRDGDPWVDRQVLAALDFVAEGVQHGKVLIACAAGMSRSASMAIGFLVRSGWDEATAFEQVRAARPRIAPVPKMLKSVLLVVTPVLETRADKQDRVTKVRQDKNRRSR